MMRVTGVPPGRKGRVPALDGGGDVWGGFQRSRRGVVRQGVSRGMRTIIAPFAGLAVLTSQAGAAWAASPVYCALYAKEFVKHAAVESQGSIPPMRIHDRAYHKCLNMDDEPLLPTAYADPGSEGADGLFSFVEGANEPTEKATKRSAVETSAAPGPELPPDSSGRSSGYAMGSPEWRAWCSQHFPNSFDPKTGTVVPYKTGVRTICR